jgi:hypothetical protein
MLTVEPWGQPDEGQTWFSTLSFMQEEHARRAAKALLECGAVFRVQLHVYRDAATICSVDYYYRDGRLCELTVFDQRKPSLFNLDYAVENAEQSKDEREDREGDYR